MIIVAYIFAGIIAGLLALANYRLYRIYNLVSRRFYEPPSDGDVPSVADGGIDLMFFNRPRHKKASSPVSKAKKWIQNRETASREVM